MSFFHLVTVCLVVLLSIVYARPKSSSTNLVRGPECQDVGMLACFVPVLGFSMITQRTPGTAVGQVMTEEAYSNICSIAQTATTCAENWTNRCLPAETLANIQIVVNGTKRLLTMCHEPDSYSKFIKLTSCGEKIKADTETCSDTVRTAIPETQAIMTFSDSSEGLAQMENPQKPICCAVKHIMRCIAPSLESSCTPGEKAVTERFEERMLGAFECTDAIYQACSQK